MIAACAYYLINCFILIKQVKTSTFNPVSLKGLSLRSLEKGFKNDSVKIIKRLRPHFFDEKVSLTHSGFRNVFSMKHPFPEKKIDLSNLDIEKIPTALVKQMPNVEKLDLSSNQRLKLNEEWFYLFSKKLKELSLKNCDLNEDRLKAIESLESLEALDISDCRDFDINSSHFITILGKLKHLNISNCRLDGKALEFIYSKAPKLEYLDFSQNDLSNFPFIEENEFQEFRENLKVLKLIDCRLKTTDLEKFFIFENLVEIDLSENDFSEIDEKTVEKLFGSMNKDAQPDERIDSLYKSYTSQLKTVGLNKCGITSELLVAKLFDLENLVGLKLSESKVQFNFEKIKKSKAYENLKVLEVRYCRSLNSGNLYDLTNFPKLEILDASNNNFENIPVGFKFGCSEESLEQLKIKNSKLNKNGLEAITKCTKLKKLDVSDNNFENINTNFDFGSLKESLEELNIRNTCLRINGLKAITKCLNLRKLNVSKTIFWYINIKPDFDFGGLKESLKELDISSSELNENGLRAITTLNLRKLDLGFSKFEHINADFDFGGLKKTLKELNIYSSNLNENGLKAITTLKLRKLDVGYNNFGNMNSYFSFRNLKKTLEELDITRSRLNKNGWKAITTLNLIKLNIGSNDSESLKEPNTTFTGYKRPSKLKILNASGNDFEGIDADFDDLKDSLQELNIVSFSNLNPNGLKATNKDYDPIKLDVTNNNSKHIIDENFDFGGLEKTLKELNMSRCSLNLSALRKFAEFPRLQILDFTINKINANEFETRQIINQLSQRLQVFKYRLFQ